jgi:molybdate transport system ATP-binding protein
MTLNVAIVHRAVDLAFEVETPGVIALFGPSGAGKTTILMAVAGLLRSRRIKVGLDGEWLHKVAPEERGVGYVFQDGRLFPHMNVTDNLKYGLRRVGPGPVRFDTVVDLLGLKALLRRAPRSLSGGERQRVAIGRALLAQPRLLLMDEPLSALDQPRRDEIIPYLARLHASLGIPIVYATHSLNEVMRLADSLVLVDSGRLVAAGPLGHIVSDTRYQLITREDASGILRGTVAYHEPERFLSAVNCGSDLILVPLIQADIGARVRLLVPSREVIIALERPRSVSVSNILAGFVGGIAPDLAGRSAVISVEVSGGQILSRITLDAARRLGLQPSKQVLVLIKSMSVELLQE